MHDGLRVEHLLRFVNPFTCPQSALQQCNRSMAWKIYKVAISARTSATPAFQHAPAASSQRKAAS
ncbi:hypothetical protein TA5114_00935 [Cognatishimia activa]|uniref:Uncharacterized protein n=1 Tax=Cognatishimia activa TaxID=1715691 RepID=A0A0P1ING6_9RHOB|nr:hypothetical protein TA5113_03344 [Cognatishimia activa]CUK25145.1 hypothetical protein TA5114_00935 [Cognatishimia activa]